MARWSIKSRGPALIPVPVLSLAQSRYTGIDPLWRDARIPKQAVAFITSGSYAGYDDSCLAGNSPSSWCRFPTENKDINENRVTVNYQLALELNSKSTQVMSSHKEICTAFGYGSILSQEHRCIYLTPTWSDLTRTEWMVLIMQGGGWKQEKNNNNKHICLTCHIWSVGGYLNQCTIFKICIWGKKNPRTKPRDT